MKYQFLDLAKANEPYMEQLQEAACDVIKSGRYLRGEQTNLLEQEIAGLCEAKYCIAVSNGLDALRLILRAYIELGVLHNEDHVIVPANTYIASVLAISDNGMTPCLCDARPDTMNLDSSLLENLITPAVTAIMPVHLYGTPCWDEQLMEVAKRYDLKIIEDNAQGIGAKAHIPGINGTSTTGGLGHASAISFYPTKNLGALGDAGAVVTNDEDLAKAIRAIANYGSDTRYHNIYMGLNCRIDEIQAAMLRVKLRYLNVENMRRHDAALAYDQNITNPLVRKPDIFDNMIQIWHQYVIRVEKRDEMRAYLEKNGVMTDIHYATPPHRQPCYRRFQSYKLPVTNEIADQAISLPIGYPITADDAKQIAQIINNFKG